MNLYCTQALQKAFGWKFQKQSAPTDPLDSWYAHLIPIGRRGLLMVTLLDFRFCVVIPPPKGGDWAELEASILQRIRETLLSYEIPQSAVDAYLPADTVLEPCSSTDPSTRGSLSSVGKRVNQELSTDPDLQHMQKAINERYFYSVPTVDYGVPCVMLKLALCLKYGASLPAMELEFSLDLERYMARRTLIVPPNSTFEALHGHMQNAFRWWRNYPHAFVLLPSAHREAPALVAAEDLEEIDRMPEEQVYDERSTHLVDLLQEGDTFLYRYHSKGNWEVQARVSRVLPNYPEETPVCTFWEGASPPEDVDGVPGFLNFLDITSNRKHPEYKEMMRSPGGFFYSPWTIENVNEVYHNKAYSDR